MLNSAFSLVGALSTSCSAMGVRIRRNTEFKINQQDTEQGLSGNSRLGRNDGKKPLPVTADGRYAFCAGANPPAGFDSLIVNADSRDNSVTRSFCVRKMPCCAPIMVRRDGGATALAGFVYAGLSTLLRLTTPFDSGLVRFNEPVNEAAAMVATPTTSHPEFTFHFLAVRRADLDAVPHRESVTAPDELTARRLLARDFVLLFAGRTPVQGVRHA